MRRDEWSEPGDIAAGVLFAAWVLTGPVVALALPFLGWIGREHFAWTRRRLLSAMASAALVIGAAAVFWFPPAGFGWSGALLNAGIGLVAVLGAWFAIQLGARRWSRLSADARVRLSTRAAVGMAGLLPIVYMARIVVGRFLPELSMWSLPFSLMDLAIVVAVVPAAWRSARRGDALTPIALLSAAVTMTLAYLLAGELASQSLLVELPFLVPVAASLVSGVSWPSSGLGEYSERAMPRRLHLGLVAVVGLLIVAQGARTALRESPASTLGARTRLSTYATALPKMDGSRDPRLANIKLLASTLDGMLIAPGEEFSVNQAVGPRTAAKGYESAGALDNGRPIEQVGGGICLVCTTLFNTVFESGLPISERHNHSAYISHYPDGRDSTVSWGGADLRFVNDTPGWLLLSAKVTTATVSVDLLGVSSGIEVTSTTGPWRIAPAPAPRRVKDAKLPRGTTQLASPSVGRRRITVKRIVMQGQTVIRKDTFFSDYMQVPGVRLVGTHAIGP